MLTNIKKKKPIFRQKLKAMHQNMGQFDKLTRQIKTIEKSGE